MVSLASVRYPGNFRANGIQEIPNCHSKPNDRTYICDDSDDRSHPLDILQKLTSSESLLLINDDTTYISTPESIVFHSSKDGRHNCPNN